MDDKSAESDLRDSLAEILVESDHHVKEINLYRLQSVLKQTFGVRCTLKTIRRTLQAGRWTLTFGWGRGKDYLRRIPEGIRMMEDIA
jgi:hypothetical protein